MPSEMRSKSFMAVTGVVVLLLALAGATLAYDSGHKDRIAKGISIEGIDVGGLKRAAAETKLHDQIVAELERPVVARYGKEKFKLWPKRAGLSVDVAGSVDRALARSQQGGVLGRTVRNITGGSINTDLSVDVSYDRAVITKLVKRIGRKLDRSARDADVSIGISGVSVVRSHPGMQVDTAALSRSFKRKLVSTAATRRFRIRTSTLKPKVTTDEVAKKYPKVIVVNRGAFTLTLYDALKAVKSYPIAVGMAGLETPAGLYHIQDKQIDPYWHVPMSAWAGSLAGQTIPPGPSNPIKARWMGIYNGAGIHGTEDIGSLGSAASHGCVRMSIPDVEDLYDRVDVGTPVYIG